MPIDISPDRRIIRDLAEMEIRGEVGYSFQAWLSDKEGWSRIYTSRVFNEYVRFLYLCTKQQVTPSKAVDACWHGHLMHSRHYIEDLPKIIGKYVHHTPGRSGQSAIHDKAHWEAQYGKTLDLYVSVFGELPPEDIWPRPATFEDQRKSETNNMKMVIYCAVLGFGLIFMSVFDVPIALQASITVAYLAFLIVVALGDRRGSRQPYERPPVGRSNSNRYTGRSQSPHRTRSQNEGEIVTFPWGASGDSHASAPWGETKSSASDHGHSWSDSDSGGSASSCGGGCGGGGD